MKFRAVLQHDSLPAFAAIASCLDKVCEECVVHLTEDAFQFRKKPEAECEVQVYARLHSEQFKSYLITSKAGNTISFLIGLKNLLRAFRSAEQGEETIIKLTRKNGVPCLTIVADTLSGINVTQDVPITRLISAEGMEDYREPKLPTPSITMGFPDPRHVRTVLDRMKALDKFIVVDFRTSGKLIFKVQTEVVCMRTIVQGLDMEADQDVLKRGRLAVTVNINELLSVLHFGSAGYDKVVICCVRDHALALYVSFEGGVGTMTYYCPLVDPEEVQF